MTEYRLQYRGTLFPIRAGEVILGRSNYASIVVNNPLASREHAIVRSTEGRLEVSDLGSKNGTYVNGKRVEGTCVVGDGDVIKIGTDTLEIAKVSALDPQQVRIATEPGRSPAQPLDGDTTVNLGRTLDLAETLSSSAPVARQPAIAAEVLDILSELLAEGPLKHEEHRRARAVLETLSKWSLSTESTERQKDVASKLAESGLAP